MMTVKMSQAAIHRRFPGFEPSSPAACWRAAPEPLRNKTFVSSHRWCVVSTWGRGRTDGLLLFRQTLLPTELTQVSLS